jgi:hypothetical protein
MSRTNKRMCSVLTGECLTDEMLRRLIAEECPGIADVATGVILQWDKNSAVVRQAKDWALHNADFMKTVTKHQTRWAGLQFTESTYPIAAFNKLLRAVGIAPIHVGQVARVNQYRQSGEVFADE